LGLKYRYIGDRNPIIMMSLNESNLRK